MPRPSQLAPKRQVSNDTTSPLVENVKFELPRHYSLLKKSLRTMLCNRARLSSRANCCKISVGFSPADANGNQPKMGLFSKLISRAATTLESIPA
jgi:hypothetical protein